MRRSVIPINYSQAASTTSGNLAPQALAFLGRATKASLWGAAFLATATDTMTLTYSLGAEIITVVSGKRLNVNASGPQQLNDLIGEFAFPAGASINLTITSDAIVGQHTGSINIELET